LASDFIHRNRKFNQRREKFLRLFQNFLAFMVFHPQKYWARNLL